MDTLPWLLCSSPNVPDTPKKLYEYLHAYVRRITMGEPTSNKIKFNWLFNNNNNNNNPYGSSISFDLEKWLHERYQAMFGKIENSEQFQQFQHNKPPPPPPPTIPPVGFNVPNENFNTDKLYLQLDSRVRIDEKLGFIAEANIEPNYPVLQEEPMVYTVNQFNHCDCVVCGTTAISMPIFCSICFDVCYCSNECAEHDRSFNSHQFECGFVRIIQRTLGDDAYQAYRFLNMFGAYELIQLEEEEEEEQKQKQSSSTPPPPPPPNHQQNQKFCLQDVKTTMKRTDALWLFAQTQRALRTRIVQRNESMHHLDSAIVKALFLASLYEYKQRLCTQNAQITGEKFKKLCTVLALEIAKVPLNVYHSNDMMDMSYMRQFQYLIGSRIGHSCVPNATWSVEDGNHLLIITTKPIKIGEEICINYNGFFPIQYSYIERQKKLSSFYLIPCGCAHCYAELRYNFSLRCTNCSAPVPYDVVKSNFYNDLCIRCKNRYEHIDQALTIQQRYNALIDRIESSSSSTLTSSTMTSSTMSTLSSSTSTSISSSTVSTLSFPSSSKSVCTTFWDRYYQQRTKTVMLDEQSKEDITYLLEYIHGSNEKFLALINVYCVQEIDANRFDNAIRMYEYLVRHYNIHLCTIAAENINRYVQKFVPISLSSSSSSSEFAISHEVVSKSSTMYERFQLWSEVFVASLEQIELKQKAGVLSKGIFSPNFVTSSLDRRTLDAYIKLAQTVLENFESFWKIFKYVKAAANEIEPQTPQTQLEERLMEENDRNLRRLLTRFQIVCFRLNYVAKKF